MYACYVQMAAGSTKLSASHAAKRSIFGGVLLIGVVAVVGLIVVSAWGTSTRAPAADVGDIEITKASDGSSRVIIVGRGASGLFMCDRLSIASTRSEPGAYVIEVGRFPLRYSCNDDELPIAVEADLPADLSGIEQIVVNQDGYLLGTASL